MILIVENHLLAGRKFHILPTTWGLWPECHRVSNPPFFPWHSMVLFLAPWELWSLLNSCPFYPILQVWGSAQWLFYGNDSVSVASGVQPALPQFSKICLCHSVGMSVLSSQENGSYWWKTKKHRPDRPLSLYFFNFCCCHFWIFWGGPHLRAYSWFGGQCSALRLLLVVDKEPCWAQDRPWTPIYKPILGAIP